MGASNMTLQRIYMGKTCIAAREQERSLVVSQPRRVFSFAVTY